MLKWLLAPVALMVMTTSATADGQDRKQNAAAVAAIKVRVDQLRANPQSRKCLGADAVTCLASLSFGVAITTEPLWMGGGFKLPGSVERDIDGRPIPQLVEFLVAFGPKDRDLFGPNIVRAQLWLSDGEHVSEIKFFPKEAPLLARTKEEWDETHIFDIATAVLGQACVGPDRLAFYRRYDTIQKQIIVPDNISGSIADPTVSSGTSGEVTICGAMMSAGSASGISASVGTFGGSSISFSLPTR